jgi:hypothetical protein
MSTYRAELLRSVNRATLCFFLLCVALTGFAMVNAGPQHHEPLWGFREVAIFVATLLLGRAATLAAGDFSSGTIRPWLISTPARGPVFLGKLAASITVAALTSVATGLTAYGFTAALGTVAAPGPMALATGQLMLASVVITVFGHAVGVVTRSVPVALTVVLAWILPGEAVIQGRSALVDRWLPGTLLHDITLGHLARGFTPVSVVVHAAVPFLLLDLVALAVFLRRDVTS